VIRIVNIAKTHRKSPESHKPIKFNDIMRGLRSGLTADRQLSKIGIWRGKSSGPWEKAMKLKITQVYTVHTIIKNYKLSHGHLSANVSDIENEITTSGAFVSVDPPSFLFKLLTE
jgi:hypothetical protein